MNFWILKPEQRLISWISFRNSLNSDKLSDALQQTVNLWSTAPIASQYLAPDLPEDWPSPWELIHYNNYDDLSVTLGILYTIYLSDVSFSNIALKILVNTDTNEVFNTVHVDGLVANYDYQTVLPIQELPPKLATKYYYSVDDLGLTQYK